MQYQSLLFSKFEQISANVVFATLLLYFGYPRKSIFSSSVRDLRGGPLGICRAFVSCCFFHALLLVDLCGSIALVMAFAPR